VLLKAYLDYNNTVFEVIDKGLGIKTEQIEKLFLLEQKNSSPALTERQVGLGLILCKDFVQKHKGSVAVESQFGAGSRFIVTIPTL
jgi:light-regulated signal transduction histidine kinase (bacteriophytochrome)